MRSKAIILVGVLIIMIGIFLLAKKLMGESAYQADMLQSGDLIFQTSLSSQSKAIQLATKSKYSHMGIIYMENDKTFVYEAVQPVKLTPLSEWIARGKNQKYVVKRLKNSELVLTPEILDRMQIIGNRFKGKNYDLYFEWSDERMYCSELVWKIYFEATGISIGTLQELKEFDLTNPEVKAKLKERYGNQIPFDEKVISPERMFSSPELVSVTLN
jgi:uncharacterized protein YycO